jgi:hypothetical protein
MRKKMILLILNLFLFGSATLLAQENWYLFENKNCSILFPKKVESSSKPINSDVGPLTLVITMYDASNDSLDENFVYGMFTTEYPDSIINSDKTEMLSKVYRGAIDGAVKNVNGVLLSEEEIILDEFKGREIKVNYNEGLAIIRMRCILVHNTMYMLQTICLSEKEPNASAQKFLNSFKLKKR